MSDKLEYSLEVGVEDNPDIDEIEEKLQEILLDLYDQGDVISIRVTKDKYISSDDSMPEVLDVISDVNSDAIRKAIESVQEFEESGDSDDE